LEDALDYAKTLPRLYGASTQIVTEIQENGKIVGIRVTDVNGNSEDFYIDTSEISEDFTYYPSGRVESKTMMPPDELGAVYYHYLDNSQHCADEIILYEPNSDGEIAFKYEYSGWNPQVIYAYQDSGMTILLRTYKYCYLNYIDTVVEADGIVKMYHQSGRVKGYTGLDGITYEYYDEDWEGTGKGRLSRVRQTDGTHEFYVYDGDTLNIKEIYYYESDRVLFEIAKYYNGMEIVYGANRLIKRVSNGVNTERREYIYKEEGGIVYTLIIDENGKIRRANAGYDETQDFLLDFTQNVNNVVIVNYDDDIKIASGDSFIQSLGLDSGYVNFYNGNGTSSQNNVDGDLYEFENDYLSRVITKSGNAYNFETIQTSEFTEVSLNNAIIGGIRCEFYGTRLAQVEISSLQINIIDMVLGNNLELEAIKIDRGNGEENLTEDDSLFQTIKNILETINVDIPNINFVYGTTNAVQKLLLVNILQLSLLMI